MLSLRLPWVRQVGASTHCNLVGSIMDFISQLCALGTKPEDFSHHLLSWIDEGWLSGHRPPPPFFFWIMQRRIPRSWEREPQCWPCQRLLKWYRRGLPCSRKTQKECSYNQQSLWNSLKVPPILYCQMVIWTLSEGKALFIPSFFPPSLPPSLFSLPSLPLPSFSFFF